MMDILKAILVGMLIVAIAVFAVTFYYSIFIILFISLALLGGYAVVKVHNETKEENLNKIRDKLKEKTKTKDKK